MGRIGTVVLDTNDVFPSWDHISNHSKEGEIMGRIGTVMLDTNDAFPQLTLQLISGETINLP
ncbi:MAG: hypothetical protein JRG79_18880, partial [Deltaproteobacteria bacterium]|nr:hypothetical protein [Deltaproteobacteria bacterium]